MKSAQELRDITKAALTVKSAADMYTADVFLNNLEKDLETGAKSGNHTIYLYKESITSIDYYKCNSYARELIIQKILNLGYSVQVTESCITISWKDKNVAG